MSTENQQTTETTTTQPQNPPTENFQSGLMSFVPMLLIFAVFYFLLIRPQEKKRKEHEKLIDSVQKGEEVLTHSGIYGRVENIDTKDAVIELEIAKNLTIKVAKNSISEIINRKEAKK
jgi:preprotein translocase subunit YajC